MRPTTWLSPEEFRADMDAGKSLAGVGVCKSFSVVTKAEAGKPIQMAISCEDPDRRGDVIRVAGWDIEGFKANPIVLWQHNRWDMPIGRATKVWTEGKFLMAELEFASAEINENAPAVEAAIRGGFLNAASVGFRPVEYGPRKDGEGVCGTEFAKSELLEFSIVTIPAHGQALVTQRGFEQRAEPDAIEKAVAALAESLAEHRKAHAECNAALVESLKRIEAFVTPEDPEEEDPACAAPVPVVAAAPVPRQPTIEEIKNEIADAIKALGINLVE